MDQLSLKAVTQNVWQRPTALKLKYWRIGCNKALEIFCFFFLKEVAERSMKMCCKGDWVKLLKSDLKNIT